MKIIYQKGLENTKMKLLQYNVIIFTQNEYDAITPLQLERAQKVTPLRARFSSISFV